MKKFLAATAVLLLLMNGQTPGPRKARETQQADGCQAAAFCSCWKASLSATSRRLARTPRLIELTKTEEWLMHMPQHECSATISAVPRRRSSGRPRTRTWTARRWRSSNDRVVRPLPSACGTRRPLARQSV